MFANELEKFLPDLWAYARMLCADATHADDVVQNACLKAWQKHDQFDPSKGPLRAWLFRIVRNEFYQAKRSEKVRAKDTSQEIDTQWVAECDLEQRSDLARLLRAVHALKHVQRDAFLLVAAAGFTYEEAALVLGCSAGTVKSRVSRAREMAFGLFHSEGWDSAETVTMSSPLDQLHEALNRIQAMPNTA
ncbi:MAG: sigma-70 family RNA polymerase sigma factor [Pseudomonadota bacterium]